MGATCEMGWTAADERPQFKPFAEQSRYELKRELAYWEHMANAAKPDSAVEKTARRHAERCLHFLRGEHAPHPLNEGAR